MTDSLDTFELPSELSALLSVADGARVLEVILDVHVRLAEREPKLEDNRDRGDHLWLVYDVIAELLKEKNNFRNYLAPEFIPKMIEQIRSDLSWYPHGQEDLLYFLAPRILKWQYGGHERPGPAKTPVVTSNGQREPSRRRGRYRNQGRRDAIRNAISKHGREWRDHLSEIFDELDKEEVSLGDYQGREIDLGDGQNAKVWKWSDFDLAQGKQLRQIVDWLRKYADSRI